MTPCPRCGAEVGATQDWCLECGAAARTRIATSPRWRVPVALVLTLVALCGVALAFAFVRLANTDDDVRAVTGTAPPATTAAPAQTSPFSTTASGPTGP